MKKITYLLSAAVLFFFGSNMVGAHMGDDFGSGTGMMNMMNWMSGWGYGFFWMGWLTMILFWTILVLVIVALWKWINKK